MPCLDNLPDAFNDDFRQLLRSLICKEKALSSKSNQSMIKFSFECNHRMKRSLAILRHK